MTWGDLPNGGGHRGTDSAAGFSVTPEKMKEEGSDDDGLMLPICQCFWVYNRGTGRRRRWEKGSVAVGRTGKKGEPATVALLAGATTSALLGNCFSVVLNRFRTICAALWSVPPSNSRLLINTSMCFGEHAAADWLGNSVSFTLNNVVCAGKARLRNESKLSCGCLTRCRHVLNVCDCFYISHHNKVK